MFYKIFGPLGDPSFFTDPTVDGAPRTFPSDMQYQGDSDENGTQNDDDGSSQSNSDDSDDSADDADD
jgi:hypothetical protein